MVNQCCCGCSLQTGTLILLWFSVIAGICIPVSNFVQLLNFDREYDKLKDGCTDTDKQLIKIHLYLSTVIAINGLFAATIGINAVEKNKPKFLTPFLYYYCVEMTYGVLFMVVALDNPKLFLCIIPSGISHVYKDSYAIIGIWGLLIALGFAGYFIAVIYSCRDSMLENATDNNVRAATNSNAPPPYCDKAYKMTGMPIEKEM